MDEDDNTETKDFPLFAEDSVGTYITPMILAVAESILNAKEQCSLVSDIASAIRQLGFKYNWNFNYCSVVFAAPAAWMLDGIDRIRNIVRLSAKEVNSSSETVKEAEAVASAIWLARTGLSKSEIGEYIEVNFGYDLHKSCDNICPDYSEQTIYESNALSGMIAFFEGMSFEDVLRNAVYSGGKSNEIASVAGSIAEAFYGIDNDWKKGTLSRLTIELEIILRSYDVRYGTFHKCEIYPPHKAIRFADEVHSGQKIKGTNIDYITHSMEVLQILTSMDVSWELMMAGVLHDTVSYGKVTIEDIIREFGDRVAYLVQAQTGDISKRWRENKTRTIEMLTNAERDIRLLVLADAVSDIRSMLTEYQEVGEQLWTRFDETKETIARCYSDIQDAVYDLQFDTHTVRLIYWEFVDIFKDLFIKYYIDEDKKEIYQVECGKNEYAIFSTFDLLWAYRKGKVPDTAKPIIRQKAECYEDLWRQQVNEFWEKAEQQLDDKETRWLQ
ncbi:MAG: HD domain-containing protein [Oscillospiraceae bacterium]|nr:HD domain-containing protein [Oscillospiraceae bacterium]